MTQCRSLAMTTTSQQANTVTARYRTVWDQRARGTTGVGTQVNKLWRALWVLGVLGIIGTSVYHKLEGMTVLDAFYMTVITLSTVGFGEVEVLSPAGRLFTIGLIVFGIGAMAWAVSSVVEIAFGEQVRQVLWRHRMERIIERLAHHYIICGYGRMGQQICRELSRRHLPFVVIEQESAAIETLRIRNVYYVQGDATRDSVLLAAGIERAKGLATALNGDADNALIVISAKGLNPRIQVVARASQHETEDKLLRAGADRVVTPYTIGGQRMALGLLQPAVNEFLNFVVFDAEKHTELGELTIQDDSELVGKTLRDSRLRERWGATVVAIKDAKNEFVLSPTADTVLHSGDRLILVASANGLRELQHL